MTVAHHERTLRGIPRWTLSEYLQELGGQPDPAESTDDEDVLVGEGWRARLIEAEDYQVGALRVGQVRLEVTGDPDEVRGMLSRLAPRLGRGAG